MNIILVSNKSTQARSFTLSAPQLVFLGLLFGLVIVSLAVLLNYFSLRYAVTNQSPYLQSLLDPYKRNKRGRPSPTFAKA